MMMRVSKLLIVCVAALALVACGDDADSTEDETGNNSTTNNNTGNNNNGGPELADPNADAADILEAIENYTAWNNLGGNDTHMESGHPGETWVITYHNAEVDQAIDDETFPLPAGSIIVKEEYGSDDQADPSAITVMSKNSADEHDWFWIKSTPDRSKVIVGGPANAAMQGSTGDEAVGCHSGGADDNDYVHLQDFTGGS
jgi:hypothetical protein